MKRCQLSTAVDGINHCDLRLSDLLGEGANAKVYKEKIGSSYFAVKIYTDQSSFNREKLNFMIFNPPPDLYFEDGGVRYPLYAWPISLVKNLEEGSFGTDIGYVMPLIEKDKSKTLEYFYDFNLSKQLQSPTNKALSLKIEILENLSDAIAALHQLGHKFVDLKPPNVGVYEGTNIVSLLDCDGFEINYPSSGKVFSSNMVSPDYIAPEIYSAKIEDITIDQAQDDYALAVIIFQMMNNGIHPFQGIIKDPNILISTNDQAAVLGLYAYGAQASGQIAPKPQSVHTTFLPTTRMLFDRAFSGKGNRPSAQEWSAHFTSILENKLLARCAEYPSDVAHIRFKDMPCPACTLKYINSAPNKTANETPTASISSFADISKDYENTAISKPNKLSAMWVFLICCALFLGTIFVLNINKSKLAGDSNQAVCSIALNSDRTAWDTSPLSYEAVQEAQRRGIAPQGCRALLGTNEGALPQGLDDVAICRSALSVDHTQWDTDTRYSDRVSEAQRRGLSLERCRVILGSSLKDQIPAQQTQTQRGLQDYNLCTFALSSDRNQWEPSPTYSARVQEARSRGFTVDKCRSILGLTNQAAASTQNLSGTSPDELCKKALNQSRNAWDNDPVFTSYVQEAQRRGFSVDQCRGVLGFSALTPTLSDISQDVVCRKALNQLRTHWDNEITYASYVQEAKRRGLSIDQCQRILASPAQIMETQPRLQDDDLCRRALSGDKTQWDTNPTYSDRVQEARNRGFSVERCRSILGISSLQTSQAAKPLLNQERSNGSGPKSGNSSSEPTQSPPNRNPLKPRAIDKFNDWGVYVAGSGNTRSCYVLAEPKEREPRAMKRDPGYVFITQRPGESIRNEVSLVVGFDVKPDSSPNAEIGSISFPMIAKRGNLWLKNANQETEFVTALRKSPRLIVKAESMRGNTTIDTYALAGFNNAIARAINECDKR